MEVLCRDQFVVAASTGSPWSSRKNIALEELANEKWVLFPPTRVTRAYTDKIFCANGLAPPRASVTSFSMHLRMHLLATAHFLTIVQKSVVRYHAKRWSPKALPVSIGDHPAPIVAFTLKKRSVSPVVNVFLDHARTVARSIA